MSKRIFISFAIEDANLRDLLVGQSKNDKCPFEFYDMSVKEPWDSEWKKKCRTKIKGCDGLIAIVTKNTKNASGHGCKTKEDGYIVTPDYYTGNEGVSMTEILKIVNDSKATNKIVILDCCYSGKFGNGCLSDNLTEISEGVTILTSSMDNQTSQESGGHGIFTNFLLEALSGCAANINGNITPGSIYSYIDQALDDWEQRPVFKTNTHSFVKVRTVVPSFEFTNCAGYEHKIIEPYADEKNVKKFKELQQMESVGLIEPVNEDHMYYAAMNSKSCKLTAL